MAASAGLFAWGGYLLDGQVGTTPLFVIVGAVLGFGGGFVHFLAAVAPEVLPFGKKSRHPAPQDRQDAEHTDDAAEPAAGDRTATTAGTDRASEDPPPD